MGRRTAVGAVLAALVLLSAAHGARADGMVAMLFVGFIVFVVVEVGVTLAEFLAYWRGAQLTWSMALVTAIVANITSVVVGVVVTVLTARFYQMSAAVAIVIGLAVTLGVEVPLAVAINHRAPDRRRLLVTAIRANVGTYLVAVAIMAVPVRVA